jgi:hypothetical protein
LAGTKHLFSGFNQPRQCSDAVVADVGDGRTSEFRGRGHTQRIIASSRSALALRTTGDGMIGKHAAHRRHP